MSPQLNDGNFGEYSAFIWNSEEGIQPWMDGLIKAKARAAKKAAAAAQAGEEGGEEGADGGVADGGDAAADNDMGSSFWSLLNSSAGAGGERFKRAPYYGLFR